MEKQFKNIRDRTLKELEIDYDSNIDNFLKSLSERIEIGEYINSKYSQEFKPIPVELFRQQVEFLKELKNDKKYNKSSDIINKAPHYNTGKYECIEVMREVFGDEKLKIWCILNAFKYLYRCYYKNGNQDLQKATYYLNYINKNLIDKEIN